MTDYSPPSQPIPNEPGACADPSCPVLHADPSNPIHPPFYEPGGPFVDVPEWAKEADDV